MEEIIKNENGTEVSILNETKLSLKDMQDYVGGYIELVYDDGDTQIVCNEEGKLTGMLENKEATDLWNDALEKFNTNPNFVNSDYLVGDVLILKDKARMD